MPVNATTLVVLLNVNALLAAVLPASLNMISVVLPGAATLPVILPEKFPMKFEAVTLPAILILPALFILPTVAVPLTLKLDSVPTLVMFG